MINERRRALNTAAKRRWRKANRSRERATWRRFYANNREKCLEKERIKYAKNPEKYREKQRRYAMLSKGRRQEYMKLYSIENRARLRKQAYRRALESLYGLSESEFEDMKISQDSACLICRRTDRKLVVDHCHRTEKVRGLLCTPCNTALGWYEKHVDKIGSYLVRAKVAKVGD